MIDKVDPELLLKAYNTLSLAATGEVAIVDSMIGKQFTLIDEEHDPGDEDAEGSTTTTFEIADNPITQMVEAVRTVFPEPASGASATLRLYQLFVTINKGDLSPLVQHRDSDMYIHSSLIKAAATATLELDDTFEAGTLLIEAANYFAAGEAA